MRGYYQPKSKNGQYKMKIYSNRCDLLFINYLKQSYIRTWRDLLIDQVLKNSKFYDCFETFILFALDPYLKKFNLYNILFLDSL